MSNLDLLTSRCPGELGRRMGSGEQLRPFRMLAGALLLLLPVAAHAQAVWDMPTEYPQTAMPGLGLTLALHIAQEHGGLVQLDESAPGKTIFSLRLNNQALRLLHTAKPGAKPGNQPEVRDADTRRSSQ